MKSKKSSKVRKKRWYKIVAPKLFNNYIMGESCVYDQRELLGRHILVNMMNLSHDPKMQQMNVTFKISELGGDQVKTEIVGFSLVNSAIKRLVRRGCTRIDDIVICKTSDDKKIKIKPFLLTRTHIKSGKRSALRKLLIDTIVSNVHKMTYDQFIDSLVSFKFKKGLRSALGKISPLRACEIKDVSFASEKESSKKMIRPKKVEAPKKETVSKEAPEQKSEQK